MPRKPYGPPAWIDPTILYSRQDIAERVGLTDDILSFWIKRRLLIPEGASSGKGVHHKFHYSQVNVASVLKAMRDHFGANIGTLKSLADTMQNAIGLFRRTKASPDAWMAATWLADKLGRFRTGEEIEVTLLLPEAGGFRDDNFRAERRVAASEAEIVADSLQVFDGNPSDIIHLAEMLGPGKNTEYEIAIVTLGIPLTPRRAGAPFYWLLYQINGEWIVRLDSDEGSTSREEVPPAMFLPVYRMVGKAWNIPPNLTALDKCARMRAALKDAGVKAEVSPGDPYPEVRVARAEDNATAQDVLNNFYKPDWLKERDGDDFSSYRDPGDYDEIYWTPEDHAAEIQSLKDRIIELDKKELVGRGKR